VLFYPRHLSYPAGPPEGDPTQYAIREPGQGEAVSASSGDVYAGGYCGLIATVLIVVGILALGALVFLAMVLILHTSKHSEGQIIIDQLLRRI
jgi:hypothetical protein